MAGLAFDWSGDPGDTCLASVAGYECYAEDLGPGWFAAVDGPGGFRFHSGDAEILPRSGAAARRLCELVVRAALAASLSGLHNAPLVMEVVRRNHPTAPVS